MGKIVDTPAILQVLGCIYTNPSLLDFTDKYNLCKHDFVESFHKMMYKIMFQLHSLDNAKQFNAVVIEDYLNDKPEDFALFKKNDGEKWLAEVSKNAQPELFDFYYNRVKKLSLLRAYQNCGIDVSDIYDPDEVFDQKKINKQGEWLTNHSIADIVKLIDEKIDRVKAEYTGEEFQKPRQAGTGIKELIGYLKCNPDYGLPLYGSLINTVARGARLGKFYLRSAPSGHGKAIPNDTLIPTPIGWRKVGDIEVGDSLFGQDGKATRVKAIYPQPEEKEIWEITFSDGRVAKCCADHLWEYSYKSHRKWETRVESIKEIYNRTLSLKGGLKDDKGWRYRIKLNEPVQYCPKPFSIHPYIMGAILGDGSLRYQSSNKALTFSSNNEELPNKIAKLLGDNWIAKKNSDFNFNYTFKQKDNMKHNLWVEELFKDYPGLWQAKSEDKYIPQDYLYGSIKQRYQLLQGLLDTDGSIDKNKGRVTFFTISEKLKDNIVELCRSLGFITGVILDRREEKYCTGVGYIVTIQCPKEVKKDIFTLSYKKNIAIEYANNGKRSEHKDFLAIIDIKQTTIKTKMTCFTVANNSHLFLMNDYIVTHNTRTMVADAAYMSCGAMWEEGRGWTVMGAKQPTLYITTEQRLDEVQTMLLAFIAGVDEDKILEGRCSEEESERLAMAASIIQEAPLYIEEMPDFSMTDIESQIKRGIRDYEAHYIFLDYIHSSIKILEEITRRTGGIKLREDNVLFMIAIKIKDICVQNDVFILSSTQLSADWKTATEPDQNLLRGELLALIYLIP